MLPLETKKDTPNEAFIIRFQSVLRFGKYKHYSVRYVISINPSYLLWVEANTHYSLSNKVRRRAEASLKNQKRLANQVQHIGVGTYRRRVGVGTYRRRASNTYCAVDYDYDSDDCMGCV